MLKTDANLNTTWQYNYPTTNGGTAKGVAQNTKTGEFVACGTIGSNIYILTVNAQGTIISAKSKLISAASLAINGTALNGNLSAVAIKATRDGGFVIAGSTGSSNIKATALLFKIDASLNVLWAKNYGVGAGEISFVEEAPDGGFLLTGTTRTSEAVAYQTSLLFVKTDENGNFQ